MPAAYLIARKLKVGFSRVRATPPVKVVSQPHDHPHHHHGETTGRALWLATGLTLAYAGVEAGVGWWAGSLALVATLLSGIVIAFTGWISIDPLLSLGIGALVLTSSLRLLREALHGLMEGTPLNIAQEAVGRALATVPGIASVHDLHIWSVAPEQVMLSAHLVVRDLRQWETVLDACHALLAERFAIEHATLQPEPETRTVRWVGKPPINPLS